MCFLLCLTASPTAVVKSCSCLFLLFFLHGALWLLSKEQSSEQSQCKTQELKIKNRLNAQHKIGHSNYWSQMQLSSSSCLCLSAGTLVSGLVAINCTVKLEFNKPSAICFTKLWLNTSSHAVLAAVLCVSKPYKSKLSKVAWTQQPSHKSLAVIPVLKVVKGLLEEKIILSFSLAFSLDIFSLPGMLWKWKGILECSLMLHLGIMINRKYLGTETQLTAPKCTRAAQHL